MFSIFTRRKKQEVQASSSFELVVQLISDLNDDMAGTALNLNTKLEDLGFDSIMFMNLVLSLEDIIPNIDIEEIADKIDLASLETIQDIVDMVDSLSLPKE